MKTVFKKMLSLVLVAMLLVSAVPFQASAAELTDPATAAEPEAPAAEPAAEPEAPAAEPAAPAAEPVALGTLTIVVYDDDRDEMGVATFYGQAEYSLGEPMVEECLKQIGYQYQYGDWAFQGARGPVDMTEGDVQINLVIETFKTPGNRKFITLTIAYNDGTSDRETIEMLAGDEILTAIKEADVEISRKGYYLAGWSFDMNCTDDIGRDDVANEDMTIFAEWEKRDGTDPDDDNDDGYFNGTYDDDDDDDGDNKDEVLLRIYVNGNTKRAAKVYDMEDYDNDGKITLSEAEKVVKKYYEQESDDDDMDVDGLFTYSTWNGGDYDMDDAKDSIRVKDNGDTIIYVMVRDAKKISSGTADSTNPKTGDNIMMVMTVMTVSAAALAAAYITCKKRAVK